ncbi:MAG TPA: hypothetical protein VNF48_01810 [Gammaproteobacteria bacterium]|nr:hypothetical protein [Gammaproteobacteria bacterium]
MWKRVVFGAFGCAALAGCASVKPIQQDQPLMLASGDGIAVVQFDALDHLTQVQIVSAQSGGVAMNIPSVPMGKSTFLFEVPAGRYCLQRFWFENILIYQKDGNSDCFVVPAGEVGFSGIYSPRGEHGQIVTGQDLDVASDSAELKRDYPHIAAQFLKPEPAPVTAVAPAPTVPPPAGNDQVSTWLQHQTNPLEDSVYMRNNTQWPIAITLFVLYDCANIKPACTTTHPDFKLAPHQTRIFMQIEPGDPQGAYAFYYRFSYRFQMSGHK